MGRWCANRVRKNINHKAAIKHCFPILGSFILVSIDWTSSSWVKHLRLSTVDRQERTEFRAELSKWYGYLWLLMGKHRPVRASLALSFMWFVSLGAVVRAVWYPSPLEVCSDMRHEAEIEQESQSKSLIQVLETDLQAFRPHNFLQHWLSDYVVQKWSAATGWLFANDVLDAGHQLLWHQRGGTEGWHFHWDQKQSKWKWEACTGDWDTELATSSNIYIVTSNNYRL